MNEPLITKHGAATLLGITKAALMKLVKADQVPYVRLPGKGEVRFDGQDLQKFVNSHKGGNMQATATLSERHSMQEHCRKRPEYLAEIQRLTEKQAEIQAQVNNGELTIRALYPVETKLDHLRGILGKIDNQFRNSLLGSCQNDDLQDEFFEFTQQFQAVNHELEQEKRRLEETQDLIKRTRKELESLTKNELSSDKDWIEKKRQLLRRDEKTKVSKVNRIQELTEQRETIQAEKDRVRELMMFDGEAGE